jgi:hypothetical protein
MSTPLGHGLGHVVSQVVVLGTAGAVTVLGLAGLGVRDTGSVVVHQAAETTVKSASRRVPQPGWRIVDLTSANAFPGDQLEDVATVGPGDAWAVGSTGGNADSTPLIRRWDGNSWRTVTPPSLPKGARNGVLRKVVAYSPTDVWIFGDRKVDGLIGPSGFGLHWNGASWHTTDFGSGAVSDAVALGPNDLWVVGDRSTSTDPFLPFARHFDGHSWKKAAVPGGPWALSARSAKDIWAVGETSGGKPRASVAHWNGRKWRSMPRPRPSLRRNVQYRISDVFAHGAKDVWATLTLNDVSRSGTPAGSLLMHWNGRMWTQLKVGLRKDTLFDLTPDGNGGMYALSFISPTRTDLLHYIRGKVTRQKAPARAGTTGDLRSLARIPGTSSLWAAGDLIARNRTVAAISKYGS